MCNAESSPTKTGRVVEESFTHPTNLSTTSNLSFQRIEWIGDAVLRLAIRKWIYKKFPDLELGNMVLLEASLVCNKTLAFLAYHGGTIPNHSTEQ